MNKQISARNAFVFVLTCCMLYAFPIILADVYYRDDFERVLNPAAGWYTLGRPTADLLMRLFSFNIFELTDTAPFTLLLGILFISWVLWTVAKRNETILTIGSLCPYILLLISPFFLQNISYKYDSLPMIAALAISILAYFYPRDRGVKSYLIPMAYLFLALTLYQPCTNIFIGLYGVNLLIGFNKNSRSPLQETLWAGVVLLSAYILYFVIINKMLGMSGGRDAMVPLPELADYLIKHTKILIHYIKSAITRELKIILYVTSLCVVYAFFLNVYNFLQDKQWSVSTLLSLLLMVLSPIVIFLAFLGPLFLLREGMTDVRVLSGVSATLFLHGYSLVVVLRKLKPKWMLLSLVPVFYFTAVSFQYANAVKNQHIYEDRIFSWLIYDLMAVNANNHGKIFINNYPGTAPITQTIVNHQAIIDLMYTPSYGWISRRTLYSMGLNNVDLGWGDNYGDMLQTVCSSSSTPLKDNKFYTIYAVGDNTLVWFKNKFKTLCGKR
ncbi:glucosyltransferase domain-containing protein [Serratia sp. DD3]|uniref:glucosyltransferase domain-containing protein n=1 Tax=Serratia sp. DD3 TaxID=1410619 RepID=UPI001F25491A|nr:glucosyltransferase domain-containing protein [Serratia sp. DD3]